MYLRLITLTRLQQRISWGGKHKGVGRQTWNGEGEHNTLSKQITRDNLVLRETTMNENKMVQVGVKWRDFVKMLRIVIAYQDNSWAADSENCSTPTPHLNLVRIVIKLQSPVSALFHETENPVLH